MGNYNTRSVKRENGAVFRQSLLDFPCPVVLGLDTPSFGLHRFNKALRFIPSDDERFTMRRDKQRLFYKGRRRSHRFTILGDTAFEYDCILEREPESNVISLRMEGAENFDFLRQPDFLKEPLLAGSYAVYKKETLIGEGTGKLCHIHKPEIIDARGRRCWGDLAIVGDTLLIIIPEKWLSKAKYPVIVDPTIGTTTVGSQYKWDADPPEPWAQLMFEGSIPVNRFLVSDTINGTCTAYMYSYVDNYDENGGRPVLYSDNGNSPLTRKSMNENFADFTVGGGKPAGWRSATFNSNGQITSGSYIWFGVFVDFFWEPRFDYGAKCYSGDWFDKGSSVPDTYPMYNVNFYEDFKLSMYFTYTTAAQNYIRTLTQGVTLSDNRKLTGNYKRNLTQIAGVNSLIGRVPLFVRNITEQIKITIGFEQLLLFSRKCIENVNVNSGMSKIVNVFRKVQDYFSGIDSSEFSILILRAVADTATVQQENRQWWVFVRSLVDIAGNIAETSHKTEYHRFTADAVYAAGAVFRGLLLFVRIVSRIFVRDYLLRRFLIAREEVVLKSSISREIVMESKIQ